MKHVTKSIHIYGDSRSERHVFPLGSSSVLFSFITPVIVATGRDLQYISTVEGRDSYAYMFILK